jgi:hypothetical protein
MYAYPFGENYLASFMPFFLWLAGVMSLLRRQKGWILAALLIPQILLFGTAAAGYYPYGGHPRLSLFLAPSICLLIAAGVLQVARRLQAPGRPLFLAIVSLVLLLVPAVFMARAVLQRIDEHRNGSIKRGLTELLESRAPGDIFRRSSPPAEVELGNEYPHLSFQQTSEYYLHVLNWPTSLDAPIPHDAAPGRRLILIGLLHPDQSAADAPPDPLASQSPEIATAWKLKRKLELGPRGSQQLAAFEYEPAASRPHP